MFKYDRTPFTLNLDLWNASWQRPVISFSFQLTRELITFQFNPICFAIHKDILFPYIGLLSRYCFYSDLAFTLWRMFNEKSRLILSTKVCTVCYIHTYGRVSFETSFDSKQPKQEPKLVSALSEIKRLFRLFRFYTETESFDVSIEPKQTEDQPKQFDREHILIFFTENFVFFSFSVFSVFSDLFRNSLFRCFPSIPKQRDSMFRLNWEFETNRSPTQTV